MLQHTLKLHTFLDIDHADISNCDSCRDSCRRTPDITRAPGTLRMKGALDIKNQQEHHARVSFRDELIALLEAHGVEYDPHWKRRLYETFG